MDGTALPDWRRFAARRALRIYPLYLVCLALSVVNAMLYYAQSPSLLDVGAHVLMLHGFFVPYVTQINGPLWTMAVDAQFSCSCRSCSSPSTPSSARSRRPSASAGCGRRSS